MPDDALTQEFTSQKEAFLQGHMLTIMGGAPSDSDMADRAAISGYRPSRKDAAVALRPGEPTPSSVPVHPAKLWRDELREQHYVRSTPKLLGFGLSDGNAKYFPEGTRPRHRLFKVTFAAPHNPASATKPNAYYLPYQPKKTFSMTLDNQAEFFFTDAINGCSFQVSGTRKRPKVTHANVQGVFNEKMKREFLHRMLEPSRKEAATMGARIPTSRLQRFEPTRSAASKANLNIVEYGNLATANTPVTTLGGYTPGKTVVQSQGSTWEVTSFFSDPGGNTLDPSGGEVAVSGFKDASDDWTFYWQMYLPVVVKTEFCRVTPRGAVGRDVQHEHTVVYHDYYPIVQRQQLWP
jgi:hypothetical protein